MGVRIPPPPTGNARKDLVATQAWAAANARDRKAALLLGLLLGAIILGLLLSSCEPVVVSTEVLPAEAQRVIDRATATAAAQASLDARVTAQVAADRETSTAVAASTLLALGVEQTQAALASTQDAAHAQATQAAAASTSAVAATQAWETPTAAALATAGALRVVDNARAQAQAQSWADFLQLIEVLLLGFFIIGGLTLIAVVAIDRISRIQIAFYKERAEVARAMFQILPPGHWAEYDPEEGYQVYALPALAAPDPVVIENVAPTHNEAFEWRQSIRLFCWWGDKYGFALSDLGPGGQEVVTAPAWRLLTRILKEAGVLADMPIPGDKGRETSWAPNWSYRRLHEELNNGKLRLTFPSKTPPAKVKFIVPVVTA